MKTPITHGRSLAIAAGCAFTTGGLTILLGTALLKPQDWAAYHVLTILTVFGTIAAGHLLAEAARARHALAALGFLALFIGGTALVVYQSVGRQAETSDAKALDAEASNAAIIEKHNDLEAAKDRLDKANDKIDLYTNGGTDPDTGKTVKARCGDVCRDWKQRAADIQVTVAKLEGDLRDLGPQKPVNAKAAKMADVAALFGFDRAKAVAAFTVIEPFLLTLFFEIGSIISLGFAFRRGSATLANHGAAEKPAATVKSTVSNDNGCPPPKGGHRATVAANNSRTVASKAAAEADVIRLVARGEELPNQDALASRWGVHKGTASKWLADFERRGLVTRARDGRNKRVAAA